MKTPRKFLFVLIFYSITNVSLAQVPGNQRGLYIDKFVVLNNNNDINTSFSILGNSMNEDNLLNYCDQNNITYITLFDVRKIFIGTTAQVTTKKTALSSFICKAKGDHCIEFVGASIGGFGTTGDVIAFDETQTPAFVFQEPERSSENYSILSFVEQDIPKTDERFHNAECLKDALRLMYLHHPVYSINSVPCTNGAQNNNIDIVTTEWEFWNSGIPYDINLPNNDYKDLINVMNSARDLHNHSFPTEPIYIETYLGYLSDPISGTNACDIASWVDGMYTGTWANYRRVDRILAHYYNQDPNTVYNISNPSGYYNNRLKNFCEANNDQPGSCDGQAGNGAAVVSNDNTDYHPIFSAESAHLGSSPSDNFLGDYFAASTTRNIFTVERDWYDDFKADNSDANIHTAPKANDISPGAAQWFAQSYMRNPLSNPITFLSNTPICTSSGNQTVTFAYQGPIEQGIAWTFSLTDWQSNSIAPTAASSSGTTLNYNTNPLPSLPTFSLPIDPNPAHPYTATLTLDYGNCSYSYTEKIYVTDHIQIYALNHPADYLGPITICEGEKVFLRVNQIAGASYQWKLNGVVIQGATGFEYVNSVAGDITCTVTNATCAGTSNIVHVNINSNPFRHILITCGGSTCSNGNGNEVTLTVYPNNTQLGGGDAYQWNTTSSATNSSISVCDANTYHIRVTRNGCVRYQSQQVSNASLGSSSNPATPTVSASPSNTVCFGSPVTLTSTPNPYIWSTGDISNTLTTYNAGVYYSIVRNSTTRCQAISNFITVTTNLTIPTLSISSPANSICESDVITLTATPSNAGTVPQFEWSTNDGLTWGALTTSVTFSPVLSAGNYIIKARVLSNATCASPLHIESSNTISFTVNAVPSVPILPTSNSPQCSNVGVNILHGIPPAGSTWYWQNSALGTSTLNSTSPYTVFTSGTYYIRAKNNTASCWSGASSINVVVNQNPTVTVTGNQTICSSAPTSLGTNVIVGSGPITGYQWFLNGNAISSTNSATYQPTQNGDYSVVVTNSNNCTGISTQYSVTYNINPTISVSSIVAESCPGLNNGSAIAVPNPTIGNYRYTWSCTNATTASVTLLPPGNCTVFVTNLTSSCTSSTSTFSIPAANPICTGNYQTCASPLNTSASFPSGWVGTSTLRKSVAIHNDFYITSNFLIQYADVTIDPNVHIYVNPGVTLTVADFSYLKKCTTPWYGIVLSSTSTLNVTNFSEVDDAIVAIDAPGGAAVNLFNSSFFRNDVSVYIHDGDFNNKLHIYGNNFDFKNRSFYDPTATYHINVQQANNATIGDPGQSQNHFSWASTAINIQTSRTTIKNNEFFSLGHMVYTDALTWVNTGIAINITGTGSPYFLSDIGGTGVNEKNVFRNLDCFGIVMQNNVDVNIRGNDFYLMDHGIEFSDMHYRQININDNSFKNFLWGIYGVELTNSTLDISRNRFNMISTHDTDPTQSNPESYSSLTRYGGLAISIQSNVQSAFYYNCHNNWIANCVIGIHSRNLRANNLLNIITQHNQIFYTHPSNAGGYGYEKGIWIENCNKNQISNNHIRSTTTTPSATYESGLTGIRFDLSPSNQIKENFIKRMGFGMYGSYGCIQTELHCNNIEDFCDGINCYQLNLYEQGDPIYHFSWRNEWNGTMTGTYRVSGSPMQTIRWDYLPSVPANIPSPSVASIDARGNTTFDSSCSVPVITSGIIKRDKYFEEIAFDNVEYTSDELFNEYDADVFFYSGLSNDPSLLNLGTSEDIVYQTKFNALHNSNLGKFVQVNNLINSDNLESASTLVNCITDDNIMEQYKIETTQIYLDCKINNHKPSLSQKAVLGPIAYQKGIYGGEATYMARALLNIFVDEDHTTARMRAPVFYTNSSKKNKEETGLKLNYIYPNPANNELNFLLPENVSSDKFLRISDIYGSTVNWIKWEGIARQLTINTETYNAGVYSVTLFINNNEIQTNKVVVIH